MAHLVVTWLLVAAFAVAGGVNALGIAGTRANLVRWGYPSWWCHVTGALEILAAALIATPALRLAGLLLGALVVAAAVVTVLRRRDLRHLAPLSAFILLLGLGFAL